MSDIYLSITETPTVVTLTNPLISSNVAQSVTVTNVVSVNVVTMPAINVTAAAPSVTTVAGTVAVSNFPAVTTVAGTVALDSASLIALENVTVTVGAAVTVAGFSTSSLPPSTVTVGNTVTINGTVTANVFFPEAAFSASNIASDDGGVVPDFGVQIGFTDGTEFKHVSPSVALPVSGTVTIGNSITIGSLPAISGTVTANVAGQYFDSATGDTAQLVNPVYYDGEIRRVTPDLPLPVTLRPDPGYGQTVVTISGTVTVGNSVTIGSVPNGSLTTRFGTPTTANVSFATSAVTNANRKYLLIQNVTTGSNVITVGIGFTPTTTQGIQLTAGAGITFESSYIPTGAVYVLSSVTASNFTILEA